MVYVIGDTVDIHCFYKNWYETAQEHLLFKLLPVSLKQIEKLLHFSFKTVRNFSNSKPRPPGQRKLGENPTPRAVRTCESTGVARGDGQAWNWLTHKLAFREGSHIGLCTNSKYSYLPSRFYVLLKDLLVDNSGYFPNVKSISPLRPKRQIDDCGAEIDMWVFPYLFLSLLRHTIAKCATRSFLAWLEASSWARVNRSKYV